MALKTKKMNSSNLGFTIVELLVVIVVIAILAAITIVSYNGVTRAAEISAAKSDLSSVSKELQVDTILESGSYSKATIEPYLIKESSSTTTRYRYGTSQGYCIDSTSKSGLIFHLDTVSGNGAIQESGCPETSSEVESRCMGGGAYVASTQENYSSESLLIKINSDYGSVTNTIAPGGSLYQSFNVRKTSVERGLVVIEISGINGSTYKETRFHAYEPKNC